jgi:hypothetical protein
VFLQNLVLSDVKIKQLIWYGLSKNSRQQTDQTIAWLDIAGKEEEGERMVRWMEEIYDLMEEKGMKGQ